MWVFTGSSGCSLVQKLPEFTFGGALSIPRLLLRLGVGFRLSLYHAETGDDFFDLATVSGVFGKYAKKSKLVVWLV